MANQHYTLWVKSHCPFCIKAKDELYERKLDHTIFVMDDKPEHLDAVKAAHNHPTVPIITVLDPLQGEEVLIGGYTDLENHFGPEDND